MAIAYLQGQSLLSALLSHLLQVLTYQPKRERTEMQTLDQSANTWYYKPIDMLVINFAVITKNLPNVIRFVDQTGYVFDRMSFDETTSLHDELVRNGFKEVADDDFVKLVGLPEAIKDLGGETQPVYSSGKFWIR